MNSLPETSHSVELPAGLKGRLEHFQHLVWRIKLMEGFLAALLGLGASLLLLFALDRVVDTPPVWRALLLVAGGAGLGLWLPNIWHSWVWQTRTLEQVARLLRRGYPKLGDHLLGIVELARHASGSPSLIRAAFEQADHKVARQGLEEALPKTRGMQWASALGGIAALILAGSILVPEALGNAAMRWLAPWKETPRYTFAQVEDLPGRMVVPYAENFGLEMELREDSPWKPDRAKARLEGRLPVSAERDEEDRFSFEVPPAKEEQTMWVRVGDERRLVEVVPKTRPELVSLRAKIRLPDYLRHEDDTEKEVRDGTVALLRGSRATLELEASRDLTEAEMDGEPVPVRGGRIVTRPVEVSDTFERSLSWKDTLGLEAREPLRLRVEAVEDLAPRVTAKMVAGESVVIASEVITLDLRAVDDYGIREVGLRWYGDRQSGFKLVAAGDPQQRELSASATFCAEREGIAPQTISLVAYAVDYLPNREETQSRPFVIHILNPEQHLMWLSEEMGKWFRRAEEVYDRERQLNARNRELRKLSAEELDREENRERLEVQAEAERANAKRLERLLKAGEELAEQATRNEEFDAARLQQFVETLEMLEEMAKGRMPSVANLLKDAATAPPSERDEAGETESKSSKESSGQTGQSPGESSSGETKQDGDSSSGEKSEKGDERETGQERDPKPREESGPKPDEPDLRVPGEQDWLEKEEKEDGDSGSAGKPGLGSGGVGLPSTTLSDPKGKSGGKSPAQKKTNEAVVIQTGMLEELRKISEELKDLLGSLQTSTFVKRLKAASREQLELARELEETLGTGFGVPADRVDPKIQERGEKLAEEAMEQSRILHTVQSDLEAYYHRKQEPRYKQVLDQMRETAVVAELRDAAEYVKVPLSGQAIVMAEFWSDTLDRWAEELVSVQEGAGAQGGQGGGGSRPSLPPDLVLEVMKILRDEMGLREETRELEQARPALDRPDYQRRAGQLAETQRKLRNRTVRAANRIKSLPLGSQNFQKEIELLIGVGQAMGDALRFLEEPDTGERAIAAETEAIELLLQTQRQSQNGGGGESSDPSGMAGLMARFLERMGGFETSEDPSRKKGRSVDQATGKGGRKLPEEFRSGLDEYFNALERTREP